MITQRQWPCFPRTHCQRAHWWHIKEWKKASFLEQFRPSESPKLNSSFLPLCVLSFVVWDLSVVSIQSVLAVCLCCPFLTKGSVFIEQLRKHNGERNERYISTETFNRVFKGRNHFTDVSWPRIALETTHRCWQAIFTCCFQHSWIVCYLGLLSTC